MHRLPRRHIETAARVHRAADNEPALSSRDAPGVAAHGTIGSGGAGAASIPKLRR